MTMVYPVSDMGACALCERRVKSTQHVCLYVVGTRAVLGYTLCKVCGKAARCGLPPDQLRKLDAKLEHEAEEYGFKRTH
jgi:hypothetical protein